MSAAQRQKTCNACFRQIVGHVCYNDGGDNSMCQQEAEPKKAAAERERPQGCELAKVAHI